MTTHEIDVVTYGRNSSQEQTTSQEIQEDAFDQFAASGFVELFGAPARITRNYRDDGKSASKRKSRRGDFNRMLRDVQAGELSTILVVNLSRFSRLHPMDALQLHAVLRDHNVRLVSIDDRRAWDYEDLGELILLLCKSNEDYEYARTIGKNTLRGWLHRAKQGKSTSKTPAYGLARLVVDHRGGERIVPRGELFRIPKGWSSYLFPGDETEQAVVRWIFAAFARNGVCLTDILRHLNGHANPAVRRGPIGKGWTMGTLQHIVRNIRYIGLEAIGHDARGEHYRAAGGEVVERKKWSGRELLVERSARNPGIVDAATFQRVQTKLRRGVNGRGRRLTKAARRRARAAVLAVPVIPDDEETSHGDGRAASKNAA